MDFLLFCKLSRGIIKKTQNLTDTHYLKENPAPHPILN